jgi:hypothetical protein
MRFLKAKTSTVAGVFLLASASAFSVAAAGPSFAQNAGTPAGAWNEQRVQNEIGRIARAPVYTANEFQPLIRAIQLDPSLKPAVVSAISAQLEATAPDLGNPKTARWWKDALFTLALIRRDPVAGADAEALVRKTYVGLLPQLKSDDAALRAGAVQVVGGIGSDSSALAGPAFNELKDAVSDSNPLVQDAAINAMPALAKGSRAVAVAALSRFEYVAYDIAGSNAPQADLLGDMIYAVSRIAESQPDCAASAVNILNGLVYSRQSAAAARAVVHISQVQPAYVPQAFRALSAAARGGQREQVPALLIEFAARNPDYAPRALGQLESIGRGAGPAAKKAYAAIADIALAKPDIAADAREILLRTLENGDLLQEDELQAARNAMDAISGAKTLPSAPRP